MDEIDLANVLLLLGCAVVVVTVFRRLELPTAPGYILVGMLVGPQAFGLFSSTGETGFLAEFGVVFLLFTLGLEFSLPRLVAMRWQMIGLGGAQVLVTSLVAAAVASWAAVPLASAIILGGAVAMSSTVIVIKQLREQLELDQSHGRCSVATLLFQDMAVIAFLMLISLAGQGDRMLPVQILLALAEAVAALVIVLAVGHRLLRPLMHEVAHRRSPELFTLTLLLIVLGAAWFMHAVGMSLAVGGFLAGMMLSETEYRHQVEADIRPFRDILLGLFFIVIGTQLDFLLLADQIASVSLVVAALIIGKAWIICILARFSLGGWQASIRAGLVLAQGGEFGIALLALSLQEQVLDPAAAQLLLAGIVASMVLSPLLIRHNRIIAAWLVSGEDPETHRLALQPMATEVLAKRRHVIVCGYGRVGQNLARILEKEGFEYIALDLDPYRVRAARQAGDPVNYGDASQRHVLESVGLANASVVVISIPDSLGALRIVRTAKELRPDVPILVRTRDDTDLDRLQRAGATEIVPDSLEAALMLASHLLLLLDVPISRIVHEVARIRGHRYSMLRNIFRKEDAQVLDESHAFREQLQTLTLPEGAAAVGRSLAELRLPDAGILVTAIRRQGIVGRQPNADTVLKEDDVLVLCGTPESLEGAETLLLSG
ncbi:MAG: cation:proton antiporter [Acidobacteria bacterium]|nr:cation:proton antiporter [Acidobacteriota bacterium]